MSGQKSLYEILEIEQEATAEDIKRAYRKMAQLYHPDKAGDNPVAQERFAEICKAYEILMDPEKRALYDRPVRQRTFYRSSWRPPSGANFSAEQPHTTTTNVRSNQKNWKKPQNDISLDDLFSQGVQSQNQTGRYAQNQARAGERIDGEDIFVEVDVDSGIAKKGGIVEFEYQRNRRMDGLTVQSVLELFYLRVPPNTREGEVLVVDKMGHCGENGGLSGNLHCTVHLTNPQPNSSNAHFHQASNDFTASKPSQSPQTDIGTDGITEVAITFPEAVLGGRIQVPTPSGLVSISIPAGSSSGRKLRLRGKGHQGSDYIISLKIVVPKNLDAQSIRLVEEFAERNPLSPRDTD